MNRIITINNAFKLATISIALLSHATFATHYNCGNAQAWQKEQTPLAGQLLKVPEQAFKANCSNQTNPVNDSGQWQNPRNFEGVIVNISPTISITPSRGHSSLIENDSAVFYKEINDEDRSITKVNSYLATTKLALMTDRPNQVVCSAMFRNHGIKAIAFDDKDQKTSSEAVSIAMKPTDTPMNEAPVASLMVTVPSQVLFADDITFEYSATDRGGQRNHHACRAQDLYQISGVNFNYQYASSMKIYGHPDDFIVSNTRHTHLNASKQVLMKPLYEDLDKAAEAASKHDLDTIVSPSSGYLFRGMETFHAAQYLT